MNKKIHIPRIHRMQPMLFLQNLNQSSNDNTVTAIYKTPAPAEHKIAPGWFFGELKRI